MKQLSLVLGLSATTALFVAIGVVPAHASPITFEFVCDAPADCDGDAGLSLALMLDSSIVTANTVYTATTASHAGFLGWTAASTSANDAGIPNYDGFSTSGDWSDLSSVDAAGLQFHFDANAILTGLNYVTEGAPGTTNGFVFNFVGATGEIQLIETIVGGAVVGNTIGYRRDRSPTCSGGTPGCPSNPTDQTDIAGHFQRVQPIPEPATFVLLGTGLGAVAARRRLKKKA